jgi:hypothetical protein
MKRKDGFMIALLLLASSGLAQIANSQSTNGFPENDLSPQVAFARRAYAQPEETGTGGSSNTSDADGKTTLAQLPRRMPGPMVRPPMRPAPYPNMWISQGNGRHALIGALIGLGVGVAVCAKGNADARATLAIGTLGAGIGAAMGFSIPSFPDRNMYRRGWPDNDPDDDEEARRSKPSFRKPDPGKSDSAPARRTAAAQPTPPQTSAREPESLRPSVEVP